MMSVVSMDAHSEPVTNEALMQEIRHLSSSVHEMRQDMNDLKQQLGSQLHDRLTLQRVPEIAAARVSMPRMLDAPNATAPFAYATLLIGRPANASTTRVSVAGNPHNAEYFNRTVCFQNRLRVLGARYPLVVLHNFDDVDELSHSFDRTFRLSHALSDQKSRALTLMRHNKFSVFGLSDYARVLYIDSDVYLRRLPDQLMQLPMSTQIAAVAATCEHTFNAGFLLVRPDARIAHELHALLRKRLTPGADNGRYRRACTGSILGDQFYLNGYFRDNWTSLDGSWNRAYRGGTYKGVPLLVPPNENVHFTGLPKPAWHLCDHGTYTSGSSTSQHTSTRHSGRHAGGGSDHTSGPHLGKRKANASGVTFTRLGVGACCRFADGHEALWLSTIPGMHEPRSCEVACRKNAACLVFSHSEKYRSCQLCTACGSLNATASPSAWRYSSWRRPEGTSVSLPNAD